jgi:hypothetical protein
MAAVSCHPGYLLWLFPFVFCSLGVGFLPRSLVVDVEINAAGFPTIELYPLLAG